jgi:hypothetical protein
MAGFVPATHEPDKASFGGEKDADHRVEPGDYEYALAFSQICRSTL